MVILELAAGILPGMIIVFSGVWIALYWNVTGDSRKRALSIAMAASVAVALIGFLRIASITLIAVALVTLLMTVAYALFLGPNRDRPSVRRSPNALAKTLYKPLAFFLGAAAVLSTIVLFAAMQRGPQPGLPIFELSAIAAASWALLMVGGVWAKKHMPVSRPATHRRDTANRRAQPPFRQFPG